MIPMLAWIANSAPANLKATYFAVMASFSNLALSASQLGTKYLNEISHANPILYMVNAFRYGFLGVTDLPVGVAVAVMLVCGLVLFLTVMGLLARGVGMRD